MKQRSCNVLNIDIFTKIKGLSLISVKKRDAYWSNNYRVCISPENKNNKFQFKEDGKLQSTTNTFSFRFLQ